MAKKRLNVYLDPKIYEGVGAICDEFGLLKSQAISMLIRMGLQAFERSFHPERILTYEDWGKILKGAGVSSEEIERAKTS